MAVPTGLTNISDIRLRRVTDRVLNGLPETEWVGDDRKGDRVIAGSLGNQTSKAEQPSE